MYQTLAFTAPFDHPDTNKVVVTDLREFEQLVRELERVSEFAFDFETNGTAWWAHARPCGIALGVRRSGGLYHSWYVPYRHQTGEQQLAFEQVAPALSRLLASDQAKVAHNIKFDEHMARVDGWEVNGPRYDTMIAARLYDENRNMGLKQRTVEDLGLAEAKRMEGELRAVVARRARDHGMGIREYMAAYGYAQVPIQMCGVYACFDVECTLRLQDLYERHGVSARYARVWHTEMELTRVLCDMETTGMPVDVEYLTDLRAQVGNARELLEAQFYAQAGTRFNLGSDDELRQFMLQGLRLPLTKLTKKAQFAVDGDVLEFFAPYAPCLSTLLRWREADKLLSTYTGSILDKVDGQGVLHTDFQQVGTNTGRLSCRAPNFQNFPSDSNARAKEHSGKALKEGGIDPWSIRRVFVCRPGMVRLFHDYSQIELRVLAWYSRDPVLVQAYQTGEDIHTRTSVEVFGTDDPAMRRLAKVINFGLCLSGHQKVLTDSGLVELKDIRPWHKVWDGIEWVAHDGLICRGEQEVMEYGGIEATPDHVVYTEDGGRCSLQELADGPAFRRLAIGADGESPIGYHAGTDGGDSARTEWDPCWGSVYGVSGEEAYLGIGDFIQARRLSLPEGEVSRSQGQGFRAALRCYGTTVSSRHSCFIRELQGARDRGPFRIPGALYPLGAGEVAIHGFQGFGFGSDRQQWALRALEYAAGYALHEFAESASPWWRYMQAWASAIWREFVYAPTRTARVSDVHESVRKGVLRAPTRRVKVYDILNAGPRRRYTVNGKIVSNSYCMTHQGFARNAKIPEQEARQYLERFFQRFSGIASFREQLWAYVRAHGCEFHNLWGRPRRVPNLASPDKWMRLRAERQTIGTIIQGTAAELTKESLVRISQWLKAVGSPAKLVTTIHDEISTDCPYEHVADVCRVIKHYMEAYPELAPIPVVVDGEYTTASWADKRALPA